MTSCIKNIELDSLRNVKTHIIPIFLIKFALFKKILTTITL